jgi:adapter protein MecA 1/2
MNIQQIGPDRLRIQLDLKDLDKYDLDYYSISKESQGTKRLLKEILSEAQKSGFSTYRCKILIEVLPGKNNGCILYITKSHFAKSSQHSQIIQNQSVTQCGGYILTCGCLEDAIEAIEHFACYPDLPIKRSSLYNFEGKYHLVFVPVSLGLDRNRLVSLLAALSEYGDTENSTPVSEAMLAEHGDIIIKSHAVESFIRYFH